LAKIEFITIPAIIKELEKLSVKGGKTGKYASLGLNLILNKCKLIDFNPSKMNVDDALIEASIKLNAVIATLDSNLKRKLRKANRPIITLRGNRIYCLPEDLK
jgi:rRNA-processing protein FCF1